MLIKASAGEELAKELYNGRYFDEICFEKADYRIKPGTSATVNVIRNNADENVLLSWSSSDENIVTVDESGNITAIAEGNALITAVSSDGKYIDRCLVEVGDFAEEETPGSGINIILIVGIVLAFVAVAAVAFVLIIAVRRKKENN